MSQTVHISYTVGKDLSGMEAIECSVVGMQRMSRDDFIKDMRERRSIYLSARMGHDGMLVGFIGYHILGDRLKIRRLGVCDEYRRRGIGSRLVRHLIRRLIKDKTCLECIIHEKRLDLHLFFRSLGFRCVKVLHRRGGDVYVFNYHRKVYDGNAIPVTRTGMEKLPGMQLQRKQS